MAERIPARLTLAEGRRFGLTVGAAFLLLAALFRWRGAPLAGTALGILGLGLLAGGLVAPARLGPVYRGWMGLARVLSRVTTPIVLGIIYFGIITPIGVVMRMLGRNPVRHAACDGSYWKPRSDARGRMTNQF